MRPDGTEALRRVRRLDGQRKHALVLVAVEAFTERGRAPTVAGIAREVGVGASSYTTTPS